MALRPRILIIDDANDILDMSRLDTFGVVTQFGRGSTFWADVPFARGSMRATQSDSVDWSKSSQIAGHVVALLAENGRSVQLVWQAHQA
jgi:hypothetical protein